MFYKFPLIRTIDDVLPHIEGFDEIIVAQRESYRVINYMVSMPRTFEMNGPDDLGGAIRRECRGIIFDDNGVIISRPIHKGFNLGEKPETQPNCINWDDICAIEDKLDGSMIRPFMVKDRLIWGTKMGDTDFSADVAKFVETRPNYVTFAKEVISQGVTAVFEWTSLSNKVVLTHVEPKLTLLLARNNITGEYLPIRSA